MMQRRGISEIYSTIMMFTVALAIAGVVIAASSNQFNNQQQSAYQMLDSSQKRMSESVSFVTGRDTGTGSEVELVNFGLANINLDRVMVDAVREILCYDICQWYTNPIFTSKGTCDNINWHIRL